MEFAIVAPILLFVLLILLDFGRGLFYYSEMAAGARWFRKLRVATTSIPLATPPIP